MDPLVVTAPPVLESASVGEDATLVNSVGAAQIESLGATDLAGALRRVPGVTISRFNSVGAFGGGDGGAIFIRGHGSGRPGAEIATMVDGVQRFNGIWTHPLLDMLSVDIARRIDVYKSPQPVLFGNMAFGAVNVVPKEMEREGSAARLFGQAGRYATFAALAEGGYAADGFRSWVTLSDRRSDGHRENADGRVGNAYANLGYAIAENWDASLLAHYQTGWANDPRAEDAPAIPLVERYETESTFLVGTLSHRHGGLSGFLKGYWEAGETEWRQYDAAPPPPIGEGFTNFSEFDNYGLKAQERIGFDNGLALTAGWDLQIYGGEVRDLYDATAAANTIQPERTLQNNAFYASAAWEFDAAGGTLTPSAGLRYNFASDFDDEYGAQAGLSYRRGNTLVYANFARAFNYAGLYSAVFNDLWSGFGLPPGAWKELDAETILHYEIGAEHRLNDWVRVTAALYYDDVADALRFDSPPPPVALTNAGDYRVLGSELFVFVAPSDSLDLFAGGAFQDADPADLPNYPEWSFSFGAQWEFLENWTLNADAEYVDEQFTQGTRFAPGTQQVDSYFVANARLAYAFGLMDGKVSGRVFGAVDNLTDADYEYRPGYPMPGFAPSAGIDLRF